MTTETTRFRVVEKLKAATDGDVFTIGGVTTTDPDEAARLFIEALKAEGAKLTEQHEKRG